MLHLFHTPNTITVLFCRRLGIDRHSTGNRDFEAILDGLLAERFSRRLEHALQLSVSANPSNDDPQHIENDGPQRGENSDRGSGNSWHTSQPGLGDLRSGQMPRAKSTAQRGTSAALTLRAEVKAGTLSAGSRRFCKRWRDFRRPRKVLLT